MFLFALALTLRLLRCPGVHGPDERAQRAERGQADDRRRGRKPEPQPGAGRDPQVQRVLHRQQADGLRQERPRGVLSCRCLRPAILHPALQVETV